MERDFSKLIETLDWATKKLEGLLEKPKMITESIFTCKSAVIPMADVQHIEKQYQTVDLVNGAKKGDLSGIIIVTKHTTWDTENDFWANNIWLSAAEAESFIKAWCNYRRELEGNIMDGFEC